MRDVNLELYQGALREVVFSDRNVENFLESLKKFSEGKEELIFYPKGLFGSNSELGHETIYFFSNTKIYEASLVEYHTKVTTYNVKDIEKLECYLSWHMNYKSKLDIVFKNGDSINLNAAEDTNNVWESRFSNKIDSIFDLLSN